MAAGGDPVNGLRVLAHAKVNLSLELLGKRPDGFHEILTVMQSISLRDELLVEKAADISLVCDPSGLEGEGNLVMRAARALQDSAAAFRGARMLLRKGIPVASGLGGASSDAACALVALSQLWGTGPVSYTHLRAHETRHDLVCRLLLEKKKNNT